MSAKNSTNGNRRPIGAAPSVGARRIASASNDSHRASTCADGPKSRVSAPARLLHVAWVTNKGAPSVLSLIRELSYDRAAAQLVSFPAAEYEKLHNATLLDGADLGTSVAHPGAPA